MQVLRFDVAVLADRDPGPVVLKLDVLIAGFIVASLRPEIEVVARTVSREGTAKTEMRAPRTAFASYASRDRRNVMGRVRSLRIAAGIDVFLDCLSIHPGEHWKDSIREQIRQRELFLLFWSRRAMASKWVDWEWRTALAEKTLKGIQPHPLEPTDIAPAPPELAELQFGSVYESYLMSLETSRLRGFFEGLRAAILGRFGRWGVHRDRSA